LCVSLPTFEKQSHIPCSVDFLDQWHRSIGAFERLTPPWEPVSLAKAPPEGLPDGCKALIEIPVIPGLGALKLRWVAEHHTLKAPPQQGFSDTQLAGPFARWYHEHRFLQGSASRGSHAILHDHITYDCPLPPLGNWFGGWLVTQKLTKLFAYRHAITQADAARHTFYAVSDAQKRQCLLKVTGHDLDRVKAAKAFLSTGGWRVEGVNQPEETNDDSSKDTSPFLQIHLSPYEPALNPKAAATFWVDSTHKGSVEKLAETFWHCPPESPEAWMASLAPLWKPFAEHPELAIREGKLSAVLKQLSQWFQR
jgi:ligand-binding SRPBCC domain-containing protein